MKKLKNLDEKIIIEIKRLPLEQKEKIYQWIRKLNFEFSFAKQKQSMIENLLSKPIQVKNFSPIKRDKMYQ